MSDYFAAKGGIPKNAKIITALADRDLSGAKSFQSKWGISWTMAHDAGGELFKKVCPQLITPCIFTQNLKNSPAVFRRENQEMDINALEKETGPWQY